MRRRLIKKIIKVQDVYGGNMLLEKKLTFYFYWSLIFITFLSIAFFSPSLLARTEGPSILTVERIYGSKEFDEEKFGPARWLDDGSGYTTLKKSETDSGGKDIVRYDSETGDREIIVPATRLIPHGETLPLKIENYEWSADDKLLLIFFIQRF